MRHKPHPTMKRIWLALLLAPLLLAGCAQHYVMTLNNGAHITTRGKPQFKEGAYVFKDIQGQEGKIPAGRVTEISPASMVKEQKAPSKPKTAR
jgi:hypothetical protein